MGFRYEIEEGVEGEEVEGMGQNRIIQRKDERKDGIVRGEEKEEKGREGGKEELEGEMEGCDGI